MAALRNSSIVMISSFLLGMLVSLIGCGGKAPSTLPPVDQSSKQVQSEGTTADTASGDEAVEQSSALIGWVIRDKINVRALPGTNADVVTQLARGAEVQLVELADKWWKVQLADGRPGYIYETLLTRERYIDPWTRFKMEAGRANSSLSIISGVTGLDSETPAVALTVATSWSELQNTERTSIAEAAFKFWSECLRKCGYDPQQSRLVLRNEKGGEIGSAIYEDGKPVVTLAF